MNKNTRHASIKKKKKKFLYFSWYGNKKENVYIQNTIFT